MSFSASQVVLAGLTGLLLGLLIWDLAFDTKDRFDSDDQRSMTEYYRGLHSAPWFILFILPVVVLCVVGILTAALIGSGSLKDAAALVLFVLGIGVEGAIAIPTERRLTDAESRSADDETNSPAVPTLIRRIRNAHCAVAIMFLLAILLSLC